MAITQTERLERETEETRAQVERTLDELRARISPGQLLDQATDYFRNSSGRAFFGNLRDQVVENPVPVTLIGAGIAWLALSGAMGRRANGNGHARLDERDWTRRNWNERDWGRTAARAEDLAGEGYQPSAAERARQAAESWTSDARAAASDAGDALREGASNAADRASTFYDETAEAVTQARRTAQDWAGDARAAAAEAGDRMRARAGELGDSAAGMYEDTVRGTRRMARKAADYGRAARHAVEPDGALMTFCREQPMLVAGLGIAFGAALGAMLPTSRPERRIMGEASRDLRDELGSEAREVANDTLRTAADAGSDAGSDAGDRGRANPDRAAADVERGVEQASGRSNVENAPQSAAPYAEAAEAGVAAPSPSPEPETPEAARNP
jgi:hypothetical protein